MKILIQNSDTDRDAHVTIRNHSGHVENPAVYLAPGEAKELEVESGQTIEISEADHDR